MYAHIRSGPSHFDNAMCIIEPLGHCKGGNFNIHIWAWFGYSICPGRKIRFYVFGKELISCLSPANVRAFHENPDRIYILNSHILNLKAHTCITIKSHAYAFAEIFEASSTNSVDPDLTALQEQSDLGPHCLALYLCQNFRM